MNPPARPATSSRSGSRKGRQRRSEPAPATWARAQLREQIQQAGSALVSTAEPANSQTRNTDRPLLVGLEAEP
jgi:hypothetical protein